MKSGKTEKKMMKHNKLSSLSTEEDDDGDVCHLPNGATSEDEALMVTLHLPDVPVLEGAKECVEIGVMSSLQPQVNHLIARVEYSGSRFCVFISNICIIRMSDAHVLSQMRILHVEIRFIRFCLIHRYDEYVPVARCT